MPLQDLRSGRGQRHGLGVVQRMRGVDVDRQVRLRPGSHHHVRPRAGQPGQHRRDARQFPAHAGVVVEAVDDEQQVAPMLLGPLDGARPPHAEGVQVAGVGGRTVADQPCELVVDDEGEALRTGIAVGGQEVADHVDIARHVLHEVGDQCGLPGPPFASEPQVALRPRLATTESGQVVELVLPPQQHGCAPCQLRDRGPVGRRVDLWGRRQDREIRPGRQAEMLLPGVGLQHLADGHHDQRRRPVRTVVLGDDAHEDRLVTRMVGAHGRAGDALPFGGTAHVERQ